MFKSIISFFKSNATIFAFNLIGLTVAFLSVIVITTYVANEFSYDTFHKNADRLYRIETSSWKGSSTMPKPMTDLMAQYSNHIEQLVVENSMRQAEAIINVPNERGDIESFVVNKTAITPQFLTNYLSLDVEHGDLESLNEHNNVVISSSLAKRLFHDDPIGKQIEVEDDGEKRDCIVGAVFKDLPKNSIFKHDLYQKFDHDGPYLDWNNWAIRVYVKLKPNVTAKEFENILNSEFIESMNNKRYEKLSFTLTKLSDMYYRRGVHQDYGEKGNKTIAIALIITAGMLLFISIVNFVNFYLSIAGHRTKSISIRRIMGQSFMSAKSSVIFECVLVFVASYTSAIIGILILNDNGLIDISLLENLYIILYLLVAIVVTGTVIGFSYSKFLVAKEASFSMIIAKSKRKGALHSLLIGLQFFISFLFIIVSVYMIQQMNFIANKDLGFDRDRIITFEIREDLAKKYMIVRDELLRATGVKDVAFAEDKLAEMDNISSVGRDYKGKTIGFDRLGVSQNFLDVMGIKIIEGRNFIDNDYLTQREDKMTLIFNKMAADEYELTMGSKVEHAGTIVGVCGNLNIATLRNEIEPFAFSLFSQGYEWSPLDNVYCKIDSDDIESTITQIRKVMTKLDPSYPVEFSIFENDITRAYKSENDATFNMILFAVISIIISLMGVIGLLMYEVKSRQKEIAVRKVYGSTQKDILQLFNKRILKIALVGYVLATPVCYVAIDKWQQQFAYTVDSSIFIYLASLIFILTLTFIIITAVCWKYSRQNPTKTLNK